MTSPESITVSLAWAQKLKEAGWPCGDTGFSYVRSTVRTDSDGEWGLVENRHGLAGDFEFLPAPSAEEILRRLPTSFPKGAASESDADLVIFVSVGRWVVSYQSDDHGMIRAAAAYYSLADAAAAMFCFLAENGNLPSA